MVQCTYNYLSFHSINVTLFSAYDWFIWSKEQDVILDSIGVLLLRRVETPDAASCYFLNLFSGWRKTKRNM